MDRPTRHTAAPPMPGSWPKRLCGSGRPAHARHMDEFPGRGHLRDRHFDQGRPVAPLERAFERRPQFLWTARTLGLGAEALRITHEIGIGEIAGDEAIAELLLLGAPHVAEGAVVEHDGGQWDAMADGGGKLVVR